MPPPDRDPIAAVAGTWLDTRQRVLGTWGDPAVRRTSTTTLPRRSLPAGGAEAFDDPHRGPDADEVRRLRLAIAAASGWEELLQLGQHIWRCPLTGGHSGRTSARGQLHDAYVRAVVRLRRPAPAHQNRRQPDAAMRDVEVLAESRATARPAPLAQMAPPTPSLAGSRLPPPRAVKAERLRRALRAALTAAAVPAPGSAIGAGGAPSHGATT